MTRNELDEILHQCWGCEIFPEEAAKLIWGQPFDGETEKILPLTPTQPVAEDSSVTSTVKDSFTAAQ